MTEEIRSFIAIELNTALKDELAKLISQLKASNADVKWVRPDAMHLTLRFLGNVTHERLEEVKKAMDSVSTRHSRFEITLSDIGCFPKLEYPRVVWVGMDKGSSQLCSIAKDIEDALSHLGFEKEDRAFTPHLTLGRIRSPKGKAELVSKLKSLVFQPTASSPVNKIILFQSTLTPQGSIYTPLHESLLS